MSSGAATDKALKVTVVRAPNGWVGFGLRELWSYRELVFFLTWRDVLIRYK